MGNWWTKLEGPILFTYFGVLVVLVVLGFWKALEILGVI